MSIITGRRTLLVAAGMAVVAATGTAAYGSTPIWRVAATFDMTRFIGISVAPTGDAWATAIATVTSTPTPTPTPTPASTVSSTATTAPMLAHWNGKTWKPLPLPSIARQATLQTIAAVSGTNVWTAGVDLQGHRYLLHWNGKAWRVIVGKDLGTIRVLAVSANDVWVFTWDMSSSFSYAHHFNGTTWTVTKAPGVITTASAVSSRDIWAAGSQNAVVFGSMNILRWNGTSWRQAPTPNAAANWPYTSILARTDSDVTLTSATTAVHQLPLAYHWAGKTWRSLTPPSTAKELSSITDDGSGGFWALGFGWTPYHYTAGKWTPTTTPTSILGIEQIARIPGTHSLWGVGWSGPVSHPIGVIIKYGN